jgi:hypothetical protein
MSAQMKLAFSIPTGYHLRELVMPLHHLLDRDTDIERVICICPAASYRHQLFPTYSQKFQFVENPSSQQAHEHLLNAWRPDVVITNTVGHDPLDAPIIRAGRKLNIKTLTFIASWDNVWKIERMINENQPLAAADYFIVWNPMMGDHLRRIFPRLSQKQISIIGAPRLDYFWQGQKIPTKQQLYHYLGFADIARPLIHFATTELYPMDYAVKAVKHASEMSMISPVPHLYASVHPGGNMRNHNVLKQYGTTVRYSFGRQAASPHPDFFYNPTEEDMYMLTALFKHAALLINHSSTVALESLVAGTPVINLKYGRPRDWWHWYRSMVYRDFKEHYGDLIRDGATLVVKNERELLAAMRSALDDPTKNQTARQTTIKRMITTVDGTAGQKVLDRLKVVARL